MTTTSAGGRPRHSRSLDLPRVLAFYQDVVDDDGTVIGWRTVAWGLVFGDGSAVSVPVGRPVSVTLWPCLEDAAAALDAHVDTPDPRQPTDESPLPLSAVPSPAATGAAATGPARQHDTADDQAGPDPDVRDVRAACIAPQAATTNEEPEHRGP
jgi:hypothetical protein